MAADVVEEDNEEPGYLMVDIAELVDVMGTAAGSAASAKVEVKVDDFDNRFVVAVVEEGAVDSVVADAGWVSVDCVADVVVAGAAEVG